MKKLIFLIIIFISISNTYSQDKMGKDVHKFLTYQGVKLFVQKEPNVASTNSEFLNWLGGNTVSWESWGAHFLIWIFRI